MWRIIYYPGHQHDWNMRLRIGEDFGSIPIWRSYWIILNKHEWDASAQCVLF